MMPDLQEDPVTKVWVSGDQTFGFIEFKDAVEAQKGLILSQIEVYGTKIKVGKPKVLT